MPERCNCGQKPDCCATICAEQIGFQSRYLPTSTMDDQSFASTLNLDGNPQLAERIDHYASIFAIKRADECRSAVRQCSANKCAIRDAFRTGRRDRTTDRAKHRRNFQRISHTWGSENGRASFGSIGESTMLFIA